jgi:hypothetical protein
MFLELPAILEDPDSEELKDIDIDINPFHIISIEPFERKHCVVTLIGGNEWEIRMTRGKLRKLVSDFMKENILSKIYKDLKDQQN